MNQENFITEIKKISRIDKDAEVKHLIANALNISLSGAYKKMHGITQLTLDEAALILEHINTRIELKQGIQEHSLAYSFYSDDIVSPPRSYEQWAANILNHSKSLDRLRERYKLFSFQNEISYFHYLPFKPLLYFKLYVWSRSNWHIPNASHFTIDTFRNNLALNLLIDQLSEHYRTYTSIDIWSYDFLTPLLHQITYYQLIGAIPNPEDIRDLVLSVQKLVSSLERMCTLGRKIALGKKETFEPIEVYLNQTMVNPNIIYIEAENYQLSYSAFLDPNFIRTHNKQVCKATHEWMQRSIKESTLISGSGEKARAQYFASLKEKITAFEEGLTM